MRELQTLQPGADESPDMETLKFWGGLLLGALAFLAVCAIVSLLRPDGAPATTDGPAGQYCDAYVDEQGMGCH